MLPRWRTKGSSVVPRLRERFVEGLSPGMRAVGAVIRELAQSEVPVLLLAEKGAGKHATARWIHEMSRRSAAAVSWAGVFHFEG